MIPVEPRSEENEDHEGTEPFTPNPESPDPPCLFSGRCPDRRVVGHFHFWSRLKPRLFDGPAPERLRGKSCEFELNGAQLFANACSR